MACPNCNIFKPKCQAECCGPVPFEIELYKKLALFKHRHVKELLEVFPGTVIPITEDLRCTFLNERLECGIYEHRPWVCQKFGDESAPLMTCKYQKADGSARSEKEMKQLKSK